MAWSAGLITPADVRLGDKITGAPVLEPDYLRTAWSGRWEHSKVPSSLCDSRSSDHYCGFRWVGSDSLPHFVFERNGAACMSEDETCDGMATIAARR